VEVVAATETLGQMIHARLRAYTYTPLVLAIMFGDVGTRSLGRTSALRPVTTP